MGFVTHISENERAAIVKMFANGMNMRSIATSVRRGGVIDSRLLRQVIIDGGFGMVSYCKWCGCNTMWVAQVRGGMEACHMCGRTVLYRDGRL